MSVLALVGFVSGRGALDVMVLQGELIYVKSTEEAADTGVFLSLLLSVLDGAQSVLVHTPPGMQPQVVGSGILHGDTRGDAIRHSTQKAIEGNPLHIMASDELRSLSPPAS